MTMMLRSGMRITAVFLCAVLVTAQSIPARPQAQGGTVSPPAPQQFDSVVLAILVKSTLMAVQHANATGNYSVLRDLGSPIFRKRYDQAKLTEIFSKLRASGVNLSPVLFLNPNLTKQPEMTQSGQLHLVGNF